MWGAVLAVALWVATDPTRLVIVVVLMSRLRPRHNLLAYWLGGMAAGIAPGLGWLMLMLVLHNSVTLAVGEVRSTAARFTGGYCQIAIGVVALLIAALVSTGFPAYPSAPGVQPIAPTAISRLRVRVGRALRGGNPWVAFGIGLVSTMPPIDYLIVLIIIVSSGAAFGTQLSAVVMFTLVVLALVEIPLVSYLVMPEKTQVAVLQLQRFVLAHRRRILIVVPAVTGVLLVAAGIGSI